MLDCLDIGDLVGLSCVSNSWNAVMDDNLFWTSRYVADLGPQAYAELMAASQDPANALCGWSVKQFLFWRLVTMASQSSFDRLRDLWVCTLRERKRKILREISKVPVTVAHCTPALPNACASTSAAPSVIGAMAEAGTAAATEARTGAAPTGTSAHATDVRAC